MLNKHAELQQSLLRDIPHLAQLCKPELIYAGGKINI